MMARFIKKLFSKGQMSGTYDLSGTQSGIILPSPDYPIYRISHSRGECARDVFESVCSELEIPPCLRPFFALCPEEDLSHCVYPHHDLELPGRYSLRVFVFVKSTNQYFRKLASKPIALNCYFEQVRKDFLKGFVHGRDTSENFKDTFKMAALDVWRMALDQSQGRRVDIASFLKGHSVEEFLPASVIASVKTPTKWLEFVCNQIPDRIFGGIERATRDKCVQCYVKTYEEMVSPDVYKFFVKDDDKDTMEVEVSAHRGIKCRSSNEQVTICQLYSVLHIEAITSHSMVKLTYKDQEQKNNFLSLLFFTKEDLIKFCFVMNNLYQLVVDANKILVEGGLKPPEVHLQLSPNDPEMFSICHRQICRERANAHLLECSNGSYLVRESRSDPLSLVLNVIVSGELRSFKIEHSKERDEFSIFNHHPFPSLSSLLQSCEKGNVGNLPMSPMSHQTPKYLAEQNIHFPIIDDWKFERSPSVSDVSISSFLDGFNESQPLTAEDIPPLMFIPHESLTKGKLIGEGNFSQVYKGLWQSRTGERKEVAIKVLKDRQAWREMQAEAERMHQLKNDNIVEIFGCSVNTMENECMVITEYVSGGDLKSFMRRRMAERQPLDNGTQMRFASQIAFGMSHLAENNMVHRDLAARNVLVNTNNVVKITDFGLSRKFSEGKMYYVMHMSGTQTALPLYWYAPECLVDYKFSKYSDVWSFGVLLFEIFSHGDEPYKHYYCPPTFDGIKKALTVDRQRLPKPKDCPQHVYEDIMLKCWELEPSQRPDFMTLAINLTDMNIHS